MTNAINHDDDLALMRSADPVDVDLLVSSADLDAAWAELQPSLVGTELPSRTGHQLMDSTRELFAGRRRRFVTAVAAAAAVLLGVIAALPAGAPTNPLSAAAAVAAQQPTTIAPPGEYYYLDEKMFGFGNLTTDEQWWLAADGSGRVVVTNTGAGNPIPGTTVRSFPAGQFGSLYGDVPGGWDTWVGYPAAPDPSTIPSDPTGLRQYLESQWQKWVNADPSERGAPKGAPEADYLLPNVANLLQDPQIPPPLRSALFTVAGELPGISVQQNATDGAGQLGEVISAPAVSTARLPGQPLPNLADSSTQNSGSIPRFELFFDPSTSQILAWQNQDPGSPPEGVTFSNGGIVMSDTATPASGRVH